MIKVVVLLKRKQGLTLAEFIGHYETVRVPLATRLSLIMWQRDGRLSPRPARDEALDPGAALRAPLPAPGPGHGRAGPSVEPEYDVVTEIWYDDLAAFDADQRDARARPERVAAVIADEKVLFDRAKTRLALAEDRVSDLTTG